MVKNNNHEITLKTVTDADHKFLYELLENRDSRTNISHKKMPTYRQHVKFVKSKPYSKWYVIILSKEKIGSIYLSKTDEIGIFIQKNFQKQNLGKSALKELFKKNPRKRYLANVNPKNQKSIQFFKNNGFNLIQYTFELEKP